jgi:PAS domain S-box-containing protein
MVSAHSSCGPPGRLLDLSAQLSRAATTESAVARTTALAEAVFDQPEVSVCAYDAGDDTVTAVGAAAPDASRGGGTPARIPESVVEHLAHRGGDRPADETPAATVDTEPQGSAGTAMLVPVGRNRVLRIGVRDPSEVDEAATSAVEGIAAVLETALARVDRDRSRTGAGDDPPMLSEEAEDRADADTAALRRLNELAADAAGCEETIEQLLSLGCDHFGLETGILTRVDGDECVARTVVDATETHEAGAVSDLGEPMSQVTLEVGETEAVAVADVAESTRRDHPVAEGVRAYIAAPVVVDDETYGTVTFSMGKPREDPFRQAELEFVRLLAQLISTELRLHRTERVARGNRDRTHQIIDMLPQLVFSKDESGEFLLVNEAVADAYGTTIDDLEGSTDADFADSPEEAEQFRADDRAVIESGDPKHIPEERLTTADGERRILETTKIPYEPIDGDGSAVLGVSTDITEFKQRERELERQSAAMEASMDGISILDADGEYVYMNRAHAAVFDYEPEELIGCSWRRIYPEDEIERIERDVFPELEREGEWRGETVGKLSDGRAVQQEITLSLLDDGGLICTNRDITDRRRREEDLRTLTERLDLAIEGADLGVWDWDLETDEVAFNEEWATMLGLSLDEIEPTLETWEQRVHPADMGSVETALEAHLTGETERYDCEHRMRTASGDWKWIRDVGEVVERDGDGNPTRAVGIHLDISEQRESRRALEEERDMFAQGPAVVFKWRNDDGWPVEYVSDNVTKTFGYTPEDLQSGEVPYATLIHDQDAARVSEEVAKHGREDVERFSHDPYRMVTKSGDVRWVQDNTKVIREDGEVTYYLGYLTDITERKRLEDSLRESKEAHREITAIGSDTDRDFGAKVEAILELGCDRLGLPYGFLNRIDDDTQHVIEASGTHPTLQAGESAPLSKAYCRRTIECDEVLNVQDAIDEGWGDDPAYEEFGLGCYIGGKIIVEGEVYGTLCFGDEASRAHAFDETERGFVELLVQWISYELRSDTVKQKLRQLNETAQRLMTNTDAAELASIGTESATSVLEMPMTCIWRYDEQADALVPGAMTEEVARVLDEQPTFEPGNSLAWQAFEDGSTRAYDDVQTVEGRYNEETPVRSEIIVPLGEHGVLISGSTQQHAFTDTDRSLLEVLAATVEEALNRAKREQDLRETRERLEQSNQELEQFAYAASHDLQEPLRTVSSYLTLLERRYGESLDDEAMEFVEIAVDGADRMREMIQALLEYSRVERRGGAFEPIEMSDVFQQVTQNLEVTIDEREATVVSPDSAGTVVGDESQLVQLFQNLVENGIKYSETDPRVEISMQHRDGIVEYAIADEGIGMDPEQSDGIFEVFQRLHTRAEFDGTGIGLSICRKIVDRHEGDIRVESTPGVGSTFVVTVPADGETRV